MLLLLFFVCFHAYSASDSDFNESNCQMQPYMQDILDTFVMIEVKATSLGAQYTDLEYSDLMAETAPIFAIFKHASSKEGATDSIQNTWVNQLKLSSLYERFINIPDRDQWVKSSFQRALCDLLASVKYLCDGCESKTSQSYSRFANAIAMIRDYIVSKSSQSDRNAATT
ncbi:MAG: hypothetical protein OXC30_00660 [Alphaproteobacteria bacterium]|nr:hypothetical protein [Alphaproteobacteria bacterium]